MGNFTPRNTFWIGVALLLLSFILGSLGWFLAPNTSGIWFTPNIGFSATGSILGILGIFFIVLGIFLSRKN